MEVDKACVCVCVSLYVYVFAYRKGGRVGEQGPRGSH